jgi:hypothetical protein
VNNDVTGGPTVGTTFVGFNAPSGLTVTSMTGAGWTCAGAGCSRSDVLTAGATFPTITLTVDVASSAPSSVHSQAFAYGGGATTTVYSDNFTPITVDPLRFVPVQPCRIADTRNAASPIGGPIGGPIITGGSTRSFTVTSSRCGIPANAQAYSLNVAVVPPARLGFLTVWPAGQSQPVASTLNSLDGRIKSNAAIVPAGTGGAVSVFASDKTDVVLDVNGYFVPATDPNGLAFFPITPCRVSDSRKATGLMVGAFTSGQTRTLPVLASTCGIPATAKAYALNFAAIIPQGKTLGYTSPSFPKVRTRSSGI